MWDCTCLYRNFGLILIFLILIYYWWVFLLLRQGQGHNPREEIPLFSVGVTQGVWGCMHPQRAYPTNFTQLLPNFTFYQLLPNFNPNFYLTFTQLHSIFTQLSPKFYPNLPTPIFFDSSRQASAARGATWEASATHGTSREASATPVASQEASPTIKNGRMTLALVAAQGGNNGRIDGRYAVPFSLWPDWKVHIKTQAWNWPFMAHKNCQAWKTVKKCQTQHSKNFPKMGDNCQKLLILVKNQRSQARKNCHSARISSNVSFSLGVWHTAKNSDWNVG